jgi:hypothetical protein
MRLGLIQVHIRKELVLQKNVTHIDHTLKAWNRSAATDEVCCGSEQTSFDS